MHPKTTSDHEQRDAGSHSKPAANQPSDPAWQNHGRTADSPRHIPARGWKDILLRVKSEISDDNISVIAAALAFYGMLAVFPALVAMVSLYGLIADPVDVERQITAMSAVLPGEARAIVGEQLHALVSNPKGNLGIGVIIGILGAIWSASSGVASLLQGINLAYDEKETRGFFKLRGIALLLTLGFMLFVVVALMLIAVVPHLFGSYGGIVQQALDLGRWPFLAAGVLCGLAIIYRYAPNRAKPKWRWVTWGSGIATVVWLLASAAFSLYVSKFGNFDKTYGTLGGVIVLLLWFYVSAFVMLLGAEINAEIEAQTAKDSTDGPDRPMGDRHAQKADYLGEPQAT